MHPTFFPLKIKSKRDLLRVRQLARHASALLGFNTHDQACLAAAAFDLACQAFASTHRAEARFEFSEGIFHIACTSLQGTRSFVGNRAQRSLRLNKAIPQDALLACSDLPWALRQLAQHAPLDLFEEMERINRELLQALLNGAARSDNLPVQRETRAA